MANIAYIGDEVTAAAYRLAGVETHIVTAEEAAEALRRTASEGVELVLLSATRAAAVPAEELEAALLGDTPLLAIVGDALGGAALPDLDHEVRSALGIAP